VDEKSVEDVAMSFKILVIEDETTVLQNTLEILSMEGFEAQGVDNGQAGIETAQAYTPDLIICDIMMPGIDGYTVLEELRKSPPTSVTPFVFLTARTDRRDQRYGMNLGADDYLTKPFTVSELLECVHARLDRSESHSGASEKKLDTLRHNIILSMPHEMRTPLTSILGFSDLLKMDAAAMESEQVLQMAELINAAAVRLQHLIENYLAYAQIEVFQRDPERLISLKKAHTDQVDALIESQSYTTVAAFSRAADLYIQVDAADVKMTHDLLKKIIEELVSNACKFSQAGTPVEVSGRANGQNYTLRVRDHGRGMKADQIAQVGAYMQFDREIWEQQGSGLGLIISKRLAELHDGQLTIESVPDKGTTVTVSLPLA
jgi:signal transduction histidine kinase